VIETPVHRKAVEPCADGRVATKLGKLSKRQQKNLLEEILGICPRATHPPGQVEQPPRMLPIELLESWDVSFGHSGRLDEAASTRVGDLILNWQSGGLEDCQNVDRLADTGWAD
jgi:hypothetical protein